MIKRRLFRPTAEYRESFSPFQNSKFEVNEKTEFRKVIKKLLNHSKLMKKSSKFDEKDRESIVTQLDQENVAEANKLNKIFFVLQMDLRKKK